MTLLQAILLGLLQGATEYLPVSSSGHLLLLQHFWAIPQHVRLALTATLHAGTALALLAYFGRTIGGLLASLVGRHRYSGIDGWRKIGYIALGTIPAAAAGLFLESFIVSRASSPASTGAMLLVTAALLLATRWAVREGGRMSWLPALAIGLAQAVAILPGVSRSGATIGVALLIGIGREEAFEFSFLLSVPVVLAAAVREMIRLDLSVVSPVPLAMGIGTAFVVGLGALTLLRRLVVGRRLWWFSVYCATVGLLVLFLVR